MLRRQKHVLLQEYDPLGVHPSQRVSLSSSRSDVGINCTGVSCTWVKTGRFGSLFVLCFLALRGQCLQMLCLPGFGTHANIQNLPHFGCSFFAYSWKLPAYSGAFLLAVDNFSFSTYSWTFFACRWSFFAYSGKVLLIRALRDCKQRSLTVSKKAPTVSKKASPHFRAFPASIQEHSPPKCLFFMANAKLPNRPGFALLQGSYGLFRTEMLYPGTLKFSKVEVGRVARLFVPHIGKDLAPYRMGKHSHPQKNRAKILINTKKCDFLYFWYVFALFCLWGRFPIL